MPGVESLWEPAVEEAEETLEAMRTSLEERLEGMCAI